MLQSSEWWGLRNHRSPPAPHRPPASSIQIKLALEMPSMFRFLALALSLACPALAADFFYNDVTGKSQWEEPEQAVAYEDEKGQKYWYDSSKDESSWEVRALLTIRSRVGRPPRRFRMETRADPLDSVALHPCLSRGLTRRRRRDVRLLLAAWCPVRTLLRSPGREVAARAVLGEVGVSANPALCRNVQCITGSVSAPGKRYQRCNGSTRPPKARASPPQVALRRALTHALDPTLVSLAKMVPFPRVGRWACGRSSLSTYRLHPLLLHRARHACSSGVRQVSCYQARRSQSTGTDNLRAHAVRETNKHRVDTPVRQGKVDNQQFSRPNHAVSHPHRRTRLPLLPH